MKQIWKSYVHIGIFKIEKTDFILFICYLNGFAFVCDQEIGHGD